MPTQLIDYTSQQLAWHHQMRTLAARCHAWQEPATWQVLDPEDTSIVLRSTTLLVQADIDEMHSMLNAFVSMAAGIAAVAVQQAIDNVPPGTLVIGNAAMGDIQAANAVKTGSDVYTLSVPGETGTIGAGTLGGDVTVAGAAVITAVDLIRSGLNEFAIKMEIVADALINPPEGLASPPPGGAPPVPEGGVVGEAEALAMAGGAGS